MLEKVKEEIGDLYPPIPDPKAGSVREVMGAVQLGFGGTGFQRRGQQEFAAERPLGTLMPVAYLWTRTVRCKNPSCGATVPLVRQTWLCRKKDRYVAMKMVAPPGAKRARFEVVDAATEEELGFDPTGFSKGGNAVCPFCGTVADNGHVKAEAHAGRMGQQMMAVVGARPRGDGKVYLSADDMLANIPDEADIRRRIEALCARTGLTVPNEPMPPQGTLFDSGI